MAEPDPRQRKWVTENWDEISSTRVRVSVKWLRLSETVCTAWLSEDSTVIREQGRNFVIRNRTPVFGLIVTDWIYIGVVMLMSIAEIGGRGLAPLGTALSRTLQEAGCTPGVLAVRHLAAA